MKGEKNQIKFIQASINNSLNDNENSIPCISGNNTIFNAHKCTICYVTNETTSSRRTASKFDQHHLMIET